VTLVTGFGRPFMRSMSKPRSGNVRLQIMNSRSFSSIVAVAASIGAALLLLLRLTGGLRV